MQTNQHKKTTKLPDVIYQSGNLHGASLQWVGMEKIAVPVQLQLNNGTQASMPATIDCYVSLDAGVKGIHMSRLYLQINQQLAKADITPQRLHQLLEKMLESHSEISNNARVRLAFSVPLQKPALLSDNAGYQAFDVVLDCTLSKDKPHQQDVNTTLEITIPYSSTCPCSATLARQLVAEKLSDHFTSETIDKQALLTWLTSRDNALATPHNQRSYAYIKMQLEQGQWLEIDTLIQQLEKAIGTPVQTAVKREDEQAFAKLNGENMMFCEDAARRLKAMLNEQAKVADYWFKIEHQESLHAHNAVVIDQKS